MTVISHAVPLKDDAAVSSKIHEVIRHHTAQLVGAPTASFVTEICDGLVHSCEKAEVLYFFLVESQLTLRDLLPVCRSIDQNTVRQVANRAARLRERRKHTDRQPLWADSMAR